MSTSPWGPEFDHVLAGRGVIEVNDIDVPSIEFFAWHLRISTSSQEPSLILSGGWVRVIWPRLLDGQAGESLAGKIFLWRDKALGKTKHSGRGRACRANFLESRSL
ncbi:hypothetical protein GCM10010219_05260 [Streptomyces netropsis]|nr:hypothetical protein GCM10010219_05260 [Streptomyces netropsis]